jgi:hypothetical protein
VDCTCERGCCSPRASQWGLGTGFADSRSRSRLLGRDFSSPFIHLTTLFTVLPQMSYLRRSEQSISSSFSVSFNFQTFIDFRGGDDVFNAQNTCPTPGHFSTADKRLLNSCMTKQQRSTRTPPFSQSGKKLSCLCISRCRFSCKAVDDN